MLLRTVTQPPPNNLPPEVLGRIFIYYLDHQENLGKRLSASHRTLCSVCSKWRNVAISTPQLWTKVIVVILSGTSRGRAEEKVAYLHTLIRRSGTLPLTLYLQRGWGSTTSDNEDSTDPALLFIDALTHHASRWVAIYFNFVADFPAIPSRRHSTDFYIDFPLTSWSNLRRIYSSNHFAPIHQNKSVPWSQLTHFIIEADMSPQVAVEIFERCPHLVEARIKLDASPTQAHPSSSHEVIQSSLRKLDLMAYNLVPFISVMTLPSLADFKLILLSPNSEEAHHLVGFLTRSRCHLDKLTFSGVAFSADDMGNCLEQESCQSLTELTIEYTMITQPRPHRTPAITDDILQRLTLRPSNPSPLCPNLLYLKFHKGEWGSVDTIVDMVSSRLCPEETSGLKTPHMRHLHVEVRFHHQLEQRLKEVAQRSGMNHASGGDSAFFTFVASQEPIVGNVGPTYPRTSFFLA